MTRQEYEKREGALRKLLRRLSAEPVVRRRIEYRFGAQYHPGLLMWHIYNYGADNCIGTVKFTENMATIRYRERSIYSPTLKNFHYPPATVHVASEGLAENRTWLRDNLQERIIAGLRGAPSPRTAAQVVEEMGNRLMREVRPNLEGRNHVSILLWDAGYRRDSRGRLRDPRGRFVSNREANRRARGLRRTSRLHQYYQPVQPVFLQTLQDPGTYFDASVFEATNMVSISATEDSAPETEVPF